MGLDAQKAARPLLLGVKHKCYEIELSHLQ